MGPVVKAVFRFRERFWESEQFRDLAFVHSFDADGPFPTWWTHLPFRVPVLTGWAGGPAAAKLAGRSRSEIVDAALDQLSVLLHLDRAQVAEEVEAAYVTDWHADPFARGAYSYAAAGHPAAPSDLAKPLDDTLFFAGEATHPTQSGTVAGAIATGRRAAREPVALRKADARR
jgi:monoamine oxidase